MIGLHRFLLRSSEGSRLVNQGLEVVYDKDLAEVFRRIASGGGEGVRTDPAGRLTLRPSVEPERTTQAQTIPVPRLGFGARRAALRELHRPGLRPRPEPTQHQC